MKLSTMNRVLAAVLALGMTAALAGCGSTASSEATAESAATEETAASSATEETAEADESAYDYLADFSFSQAYDDKGYLKDVTALDYVTLPDDYADITIDADLGQATGYAADILSPDCTEKTTRFADTRAYEWLSAYAAEYGFVLRWPEERQAATGMVYEP